MEFRASEMPRVVLCPGSKRMGQNYADSDGVEAIEGTVAHSIAADALVADRPLSTFMGETMDGVHVDIDMIRHLTLYVDECHRNTLGNTEQKFNAEYEGHTLTGTPDHWQFDISTGVLRVVDLKYGYGIVDVHTNWQLLTYAFLIWESLLKIHPGRFDLFKTIELVIVQPRANHPAGPVRRWSFDADLIRNYRNEIIGAMRLAALDDPPVKTGAHCRYCPGLLGCQGAAKAASYALEYAGTLIHGEMAPEQLTYELELVERAFSMIKDRRTALTEMGLALCKKGVVLPGWESRRDLTSLAWNGGDAVSIGDILDVNLRQDEKPITPMQAIYRKLLTKKQVTALASRSQGSAKLKRVDHARAKRILG